MNNTARAIKTKIFKHKICLVVCFFLCTTVVCPMVCPGMMLSAKAAPFKGFISGESGECRWEYVSENDDSSFRIYPNVVGRAGRLGTSPFPWNKPFLKDCIARVTKVVIAEAVEAQDCREMFKDFISMTAIDLSGLKVKGPIDMFHMFKNCRSLEVFKAENWDTTEALHVSDMFVGAVSLQYVLVGPKFYFGDEASLPSETIGTNKGTHWMQVNLAKGGSDLFPCGKLFKTFNELAAFHHDPTKRTGELEAYVLVIPQIIVIFSAGAADAVGHMDFQHVPYNSHTKSSYSKNEFRRVGYMFAGWLDDRGQTIPDEALIVNDQFEYRRYIKLTAQWKAASHTVGFVANTSDGCEQDAVAALKQLVAPHNGSVSIPRTYRLRCRKRVIETFNTRADGCGRSYRPAAAIEDVTDNMVLYAQWVEDGKASMTYITSDEAGGKVSVQKDLFSANDLRLPRGYHVRAEPYEGYTFLRWTCDIDKKWSSDRQVLIAEDIESVAKRGNSFVTVVFTAHFQMEDLYVFFYPNCPDGVLMIKNDPATCSVAQRVNHGGYVRIKDVSITFAEDFSPIRQSGYGLASWNTEVDGTGVSYEPGDVIKNITKSFALYAQWTENKILVRYMASDEDSGTVLREAEELSTRTGIPMGSIAVPYDGYAFQRWVCTTTKGWSHVEQELGKDQIMAAAKKGDTLVETNFVAHFVSLVGSEPKTRDVSDGSSAFTVSGAPAPSNQATLDEDTRDRQRSLKSLLHGSSDGWHYVAHHGKKSWFYCLDGVILKGPHRLVGGLDKKMNDFFFDTVTGAQIRGWKPNHDRTEWYCYSEEDGTLLKGPHRVAGGLDGKMHDFYFDLTSGLQIRGWKQFPLEQKLRYYSKEDGAMLKGRQVIDGKEYYFDEVTGALC